MKNFWTMMSATSRLLVSCVFNWFINIIILHEATCLILRFKFPLSASGDDYRYFQKCFQLFSISRPEGLLISQSIIHHHLQIPVFDWSVMIINFIFQLMQCVFLISDLLYNWIPNNGIKFRLQRQRQYYCK